MYGALEKAEYVSTAELNSLFQYRVSLYIPGCPHFINQTSLGITEIHLLLPLQC